MTTLDDRDLDVHVSVPARDLDTWMRTMADLADWLTHPDRAVTADHTRRHPDGPTLNQQAWTLVAINERMYDLLTTTQG